MSFLYSISAADRKGLARETPCQSVGFLCLSRELFIWQSQTFPLFERTICGRGPLRVKRLWVSLVSYSFLSTPAWPIPAQPDRSPEELLHVDQPELLSISACLEPSALPRSQRLYQVCHPQWCPQLLTSSLLVWPEYPSLHRQVPPQNQLTPAWDCQVVRSTPLYFSHSKIMQRSCKHYAEQFLSS